MKRSVQLLFIIFSFLNFTLSAQIYHLGRYETPYDYSTQDFRVIPNGANGMLVVAAKRISNSDEFRAEFTHLNTNFEVEWVESIRLSKLFYIKGSAFDGETNFLLLQDKSQKDKLKIVTVNPSEKSISNLDQRRLTSIRVTDFAVIKRSAIILGYINYRPSAFIYDIDKKTLKTLPQIYQSKSEILELKVNNDGVSFNILVSSIDNKKDRTVQMNTYDYEGNLIRDFELETEPHYQLVNAVSSSIYDIEQVTTGLYSYKSSESPSGYYINHVDRTGVQSMNYVPFGEFNSFFDHEGENKSKRLQSKSKKQKGSKKPYRYKIDAIFQPIMEEDGELIIRSEFFKPWTSSAQRISVKSKNNDIPHSTWLSNPEFSILRLGGFDFTHTFVLTLDIKGNIKWDRSSEINEAMSGKLNSFGSFSQSSNDNYYAYYYLEKFRVHNLNQQMEPLQVALKTGPPEDEVRFESEDFGDVLPWGPNNYLVYGVQHIRQSDNPTQIRKVYFINGLAIQPNFYGSEID